MIELKEVDLEELELLIKMMSIKTDISYMTSEEISQLIQTKYQVKCSREQVFLLHESDKRQVWINNI